MTELALVKRLADAMAIPTSVSNTVHLYLLVTKNAKDITELLDEEGIFFYIKHMLEKHFGRILYWKGKLELNRNNVLITISEIATNERRYIVDGSVTLDTKHSVIVMLINVVSEEPAKVSVSRIVDSGIMLTEDSGEITIKYFT